MTGASSPSRPSERLDPQDANAGFDVYARRLAGDETVLVSRKDGANGALGDRNTFEASVNRDGTKIAFTSDGSLEAPTQTSIPTSIGARSRPG